VSGDSITKPGMVSTSPLRAAKRRSSSGPIPSGTVMAMIFTTVMSGLFHRGSKTQIPPTRVYVCGASARSGLIQTARSPAGKACISPARARIWTSPPMSGYLSKAGFVVEVQFRIATSARRTLCIRRNRASSTPPLRSERLVADRFDLTHRTRRTRKFC
jgi:hypothetical protein